MIICSSEQQSSLPHTNAIGMHTRVMSKHGCLAWLFIADSSSVSCQWRALDQRFRGLRIPTTRRCGRVAIRQVYIQCIRHAGVTTIPQNASSLLIDLCNCCRRPAYLPQDTPPKPDTAPAERTSRCRRAQNFGHGRSRCVSMRSMPRRMRECTSASCTSRKNRMRKTDK